MRRVRLCLPEPAAILVGRLDAPSKISDNKDDMAALCRKGVLYLAFYHCLLLDVDGTLLDFHASEDAAIRETLAYYDLPNDEAAIARYRAINDDLWAALERGEIRQEKLVVQRFASLLEEFGAQGDPVKINDRYLTTLSEHAETFPGALDALRELSEVATLAIVSNGVERVQTGRLERSGIGDLFDGIFISSRVGASKPSRRIFDYALDKLGVDNRAKVLVVGDSLKADIAGGNNAGLATCWCNFDHADLPESAAKPTYIIQNYDELLHIVMEEEELVNVGNPDRRHRLPVLE